MSGQNELLSGGETTDICVYKLKEGTLGDQFGKNSAQQKVATKLRHIPPFPFKSVAQMQQTSLLMLHASGMALELWSTESNSQVLRIEKQGDFAIREFHLAPNGVIVYSDCKGT